MLSEQAPPVYTCVEDKRRRVSQCGSSTAQRSFKRDVTPPWRAALPPQSHKAITALCFGGDAMMHSGPVTLPVAF